MKILPRLSATRPTKHISADLIAVVGDAQTKDIMLDIIAEQAMPHADVHIGSINDAIALLSDLEHQPHRLLVDVSGSSMPLSDIARLAEVCAPSVSVVVVGDRNDVSLFRSLLQAGVHDYLFKPLTAELLQRALFGAVAQIRTGTVLAFAGTRGGVGVTTVAVYLAHHLAEVTQRRVVYVDLDLFGGAAASMLDLTSNNGLVELLQNADHLDAPYIERNLMMKGNRLHLLSAELAYGSAAEFGTGALGALIAHLRQQFHYVILDPPAPTGRLAEDAFDAAQRIHVVADRSVHSVRHATRLLHYTEARSQAPKVSLLLNNPVEPVSGQVMGDDFSEAVKHPILQELPFDGKALAYAQNTGELPAPPALSSFGRAIDQLANDLVGHGASVAEPWYARLLRVAGRR